MLLKSDCLSLDVVDADALVHLFELRKIVESYICYEHVVVPIDAVNRGRSPFMNAFPAVDSC